MPQKKTTPDRREAARRPAQAHFRIDDGLVRVYRLVGKKENKTDPIKLLEVNNNTIAVGIMPLGFDAVPERGMPYPSILIEVTPEEFEKIQRAALELPEGWKIAEEIPIKNPALSPS